MKDKRFVKYLGAIAVLAVVFILGISVGRNYDDGQRAGGGRENSAEVTGASLMIDFGDGRVRTFDEISGETAFAVLKQATEDNNIALEYQDYGGDIGAFIQSINGVGSDPESDRWWQFWVNNRYSQVGASSYRLEAGDVVEFKYIKGQTEQ